MKIRIKNGKSHIRLWLPSGNLVISLILRSIKIENKRFSKEQRKRMMIALKEARKYCKPLALIDIESAKGEKVFIEI
jgi:predicted transcriptional regulator